MPRYGPFHFYVRDGKPEITLWFDNEDLGFGKHVYLREYGDKLVPQAGVTSILKIIDRSEYLVPWSAKVTVAKVAALMPTDTDGISYWTKPISQEAFLHLLDQAKKAHKEILEDAGDVGKEAHRLLEDAINFAINTNGGVVQKLVGTTQDSRAVSCCNAALDWMAKHAVKWVATEQKVYSREYEFAGTMDGLAYVSSCADKTCCPVHFLNKYSLVDWKSSNQLSITYLYQIAAYRKARMEECPKEAITNAFILRLGKEDGEFEPWPVTDEEMEHDFVVFACSFDLTGGHEITKSRIAAAKKDRTARKRLAKKVEKW